MPKLSSGTDKAAASGDGDAMPGSWQNKERPSSYQRFPFLLTKKLPEALGTISYFFNLFFLTVSLKASGLRSILFESLLKRTRQDITGIKCSFNLPPFLSEGGSYLANGIININICK